MTDKGERVCVQELLITAVSYAKKCKWNRFHFDNA